MTSSITSAPNALPAAMAQKNAAALEQAMKNKKAVHETATKFEAMYLNEMFSHMFEGIGNDNPFSGGHGEEVFRSMMVDQYGKMVAKSGQVKIASSIEKEMLRMQEEQKNPRGNA